jgi:DNA-binding response OmpR family regulator
MRILIVEDEHKIASAIKRGLEQQTYAVDVSYDADDWLSMATTQPYDLINMDRILPGSMDGIGILRTLRQQNNHTPVLLLTAKDRVLDRAEGLNAGADDYLVKPFAFIELIARVRALLRRSPQSADTAIVYSDFVLDTVTKTVERDGKHITLTSKEFALLEYLMHNPDRIIAKDMLMQHVWNYDADILPNTVEVYIGYLRGKIDKPFKSSKPLLHTRRGFGYFFGTA